ncbi:MAG TPA: MBL fold metallo-hydrolase [Thermodesulfobacteriota bacterium]
MLTRRVCGAPAGFRPTAILAAMVATNFRRTVPAPGVYRPAPAGSPGQVTYVGHATCLAELPGFTALFDPIWSSRVILPKRLVAPGVALEALPDVDAVLVTHAHLDHCDRPSLRALARRVPSATLVTPRGFDDLARDLGFARHVELAMWESRAVGAGRVTLVPARHWGKRSGWDTGRRGFGGFVVEAGGRAVMHAGDTAYFGGFAEIGARFPRLDVAMLPIGAYSPPAFRSVHCDPDDAVRAFVDLGAARMVPIHWGTFVLSCEAVDEPMRRLAALVAGTPLEARVARLRHGESVVLDPLPAAPAPPAR